MNQKVEALTSQWVLLKDELNNKIKNTAFYKKFIDWRTRNRSLVEEFNEVKSSIKEYEKLLNDIKEKEQLCNDEYYERKPVKTLYRLKRKAEDYGNEAKQNRLKEINQKIWEFVDDLTYEIQDEIGVKNDWTNIISSEEEDTFLNSLFHRSLGLMPREFKSAEIAEQVRKIDEFRKEIDKLLIGKDFGGNLYSIEGKIELLRNEYSKYSKNDYEDYVRKVSH